MIVEMLDRCRVALGCLIRQRRKAFFGVALHGFIEGAGRLFAPFLSDEFLYPALASLLAKLYPLYQGMFQTLGLCAFCARTSF